MKASADRIESILAAAVEIDAELERRQFVDEACAGDHELKRQVEELIENHFRAGSFLESPAAGFPSPLGGERPGVRGEATTDEPVSERPGTVIGPYKLLEQIGEGGFGVVFMAEQQQPIRRKVAVKVLKPGMDTRQVIARFEAERQALALMDHPNIAKVLDAGQTNSGRPYFVMELVKGVPITEYCDENRLTPCERLELFLPVCGAVQHAHQKGIIHRDIKPSNVLVVSHDGTPVPKIIDFGVAKAIGQQLTDKTLYTQVAQLVGTPLYMSPEQAGLSGLDIDTRTDIYALAVLLYELLTGTTPFARERFKEAGYDEIRRIIREEEPAKPSTRISTLGQAATTVSINRNSDPKQLSRLFRGELDWIVMKALEKDRNRRYESASAFAADVQRYLHDEPVQACPPTMRYRLRKFVARNKGAVAAVSLILLCLLGGIIGTSAGLVWALRERDDKARALLAETKAKEAAIQAREAKEKALIDETWARIREHQARDKALDALRAMTDDIVENQMARGTTLAEENKEFLRKIIKHFEGFAAITADDATSRAIRAEGYYRVGLMRRRLGELKEAETAYTDALAIFKQLAADFPTRPDFRQKLAGSHNDLGLLLKYTGRLKEAEAAYTDALAIQNQLAADFPTRPEFCLDLAKSHNNLGILLKETGRLKEAEAAYTDALAIKKQLAADFPTRPEFRLGLARSHNNLGNLLKETGRLKEAEAAYTDALAIKKQLAADFPTRADFRRELAQGHHNLGLLLQATGRLKEAEVANADSLAIQKQLAADFPTRPEFRQNLAKSHNSLGNLLQNMGRLKEGETAYAAALAIQKQLATDFPTRPDFRQDLARSHNTLGILLKDTGRLKEAEAAYAEALAINKQLAADFPTRPEFRQDLAKSHNNLGNLLRETGRLKEAEAAYADALAIKKQLAADFPTRPDFRRDLAASHNNLGILLKDTGRLKEAEAAYADALAISKQLAADFPNQPDLRNELAGTLVNLGNLCSQRRDFQAAKAYLEEALPHHQAALRPNPRNPMYRQFFRNNLIVVVQTNAGLQDQAAALQAAQKLHDLGWDSPGNAYDAACALALCIPIVEKLEPEAQARAAMQFYGDEAMKMLRDAVGKGFENTAHMAKDSDLNPLRGREDFKKLMAELEGDKGKG